MFGRKENDGLTEAETVRRALYEKAFPEEIEAPELYDPADYTDSGELTEALNAVADSVGSPGLAGRAVVPTVIGFYYGGSPVVARLGDDAPGQALAYVLGDMLRRVASTPLDLGEPEVDPDVVETTKRNAQLDALRRAQYAVGRPDGTEAWTPYQVLRDLYNEVHDSGPIE